MWFAILFPITQTNKKKYHPDNKAVFEQKF